MRWICTFTCGHCSEGRKNMTAKQVTPYMERYADRVCCRCAYVEMVQSTTDEKEVYRSAVKLLASYHLTVNEGMELP